MADTNSVQIAIGEEATYLGSTAAVAGIKTRLTSESFKQDTTTANSAEIDSTRNLSFINRTDVQASGSLNIEYHHCDSYDKLMTAAIGSADFGATAIVHTGGSDEFVVNTSAGTITTDATWSSSPAVAGTWVSTSGFAQGGNNGKFKVVSCTSSVLTVENKGTLVTETKSGGGVVITTLSQATNGTGLRSFAAERKYTDLTNIFAAYTGMSVESMKLSLNSDSVITGSFDFIGSKEESKSSTIFGSYTAASTADVCNSIDSVAGTLNEGTAFDITSFSFETKANVRGLRKVGTLGAYDIGQGHFEVGGEVSAYFATSALADKFLNHTTTSLAVNITQGGSTRIFDFPSIKLTGAERVATGQDDDVILSISWQAFKDATESCMMRIVKS